MLPKIAYIGDVSISATSSGMLLLFRQMEGYPAERLLVFETTPSPLGLRMNGVEYAEFGMFGRIRRTRFHRAYTAASIAARSVDARGILRRLQGQGVDSIMTVTHGTSWLVADRVASSLGIPLILMSHDHWLASCPALGYSVERLQSMFGDVYRRARVRFCVSPQMAAYYESLYGAPGTVLYPARATGGASPSTDTRTAGKPFTIAYAGTVTHPGYRAALRRLGSALAAVNGVLVIYSNLAAAEAKDIAAGAPNVQLRSFVPSTQIVDTLRREADALFIPMPSTMGLNARLAFPSKLADYTSAALPIIVFGPRDSSVYCWSIENSSAAAAVPDEEEGALENCVRRLAADPVLRGQMGRAALEIGSRMFDAKVIQQSMISAIANAGVQGPLSTCSQPRP